MWILFLHRHLISKFNTVVLKKNIFVCKHLANFGGRLSSLKSDRWLISVMEIRSLNQPSPAAGVTKQYRGKLPW